MFVRRSHLLSGALPLALALASTATFFGCGKDLSQNPLFKDQLKVVQRMDDDAKVMRKDLEDATLNLTEIQRQVRDFKGAPHTDDSRVQQLEARLTALEQVLKNSGGAAKLAAAEKSAEKAATNKTADKSAKETARAIPAVPKLSDLKAEALEPPAEGTHAEAPKAEVPKAVEAVAIKSDGGETLAEAPAAKSAKTSVKSIKAAAVAHVTKAKAAPASAANRTETTVVASNGGFYYQVLAGETADQIAARHGLTATRLLAANGIPAGRSLRPGTSIFVPQAAN